MRKIILEKRNTIKLCTMKNALIILTVLFIIFPKITNAQIFEHDTLYITNVQGSLTGSPYNYLHNNHDEFKEFRLTYNVLESEDEWEFVYSDWCCDILQDNITSSYNVPLEAGDSSLIKIGVFWNDQTTGYGVVELIFEETNAPTSQARAIFIIDLLPSSSNEIVNAELELFPNPTSSNLLFNGIDNCYSIYIYDSSGKMISNQPCSGTNEIITSTMASGLYFACFRDDKEHILGSASFIKK